MRRYTILALVAFATAALVATAVWAGSPHFVGAATTSCSSNTVTICGKEAGLGDETQIHIEITATAECINGGSNHPKAVNKASVTANDVFPVQNGHADWCLTGTATFQPSCSPPMTVVFSKISATDTTNGLVAQTPSSCP